MNQVISCHDIDLVFLEYSVDMLNLFRHEMYLQAYLNAERPQVFEILPFGKKGLFYDGQYLGC